MPFAHTLAPGQAPELARKLELLLASAGAEDRSVGFEEVRDAMEAAGTPLTEARWGAMRSGTGTEVDSTLLRNLSTFFGVNEAYLAEWDPELTERVEAQMVLLSALRGQHVRHLATRRVNSLSAGDLLQIRDAIGQKVGPARDSRAGEDVSPGLVASKRGRWGRLWFR